MDQLVSTISTTVALSVCAARLGADAQLEGVVRSRLASNGDTHTCMNRVPMQCFGRGSQKPSVSAFPRVPLNFGPYPVTGAMGEALCVVPGRASADFLIGPTV